MPDDFRKLCDRLRRDHPTRYPVRIHVVPGLVDVGDCTLCGPGKFKRWFRIRVRRTDHDVMVHTLLEEYAHALVWYVRSTKSDHHRFARNGNHDAGIKCAGFA